MATAQLSTGNVAIVAMLKPLNEPTAVATPAAFAKPAGMLIAKLHKPHSRAPFVTYLRNPSDPRTSQPMIWPR